MKQKITCRVMEERDIRLVVPVYIGYYNDFEDGGWTQETASKRIHQVWSREDSLCLVWEWDGDVVGFAMGYFEQYDDIQAYDLVEIVVKQSCQGQGIGTRCMEMLEEQVKALGGAMIQLQAVNDGMHSHFYGKLGYQDCHNLVLKSKWL